MLRSRSTLEDADNQRSGGQLLRTDAVWDARKQAGRVEAIAGDGRQMV
jgi:hypothetical protein